MSAIALYTAVYPGAVPFLDEWYASVQAQADRDFDLWISLDGLTETAVTAQLGDRPAATFVVAEPGFTPAQVRQQALARIADRYEAVILVDSDDLLHPDRVAAARAWLDGADVAVQRRQRIQKMSPDSRDGKRRRDFSGGDPRFADTRRVDGARRIGQVFDDLRPDDTVVELRRRRR